MLFFGIIHRRSTEFSHHGILKIIFTPILYLRQAWSLGLSLGEARISLGELRLSLGKTRISLGKTFCDGRRGTGVRAYVFFDIGHSVVS